MTTYQCPCQSTVGWQPCQFRYEHRPDLVRHCVRMHGMVSDDARLWPEFSQQQMARLRWFAWARMEGFAFAMDETTNNRVVVAA